MPQQDPADAGRHRTSAPLWLLVASAAALAVIARATAPQPPRVQARATPDRTAVRQVTAARVAPVAAVVVVAAAVIARTAARRSPRAQPGGPARDLAEPNPAVQRQLEWLTPRLTAVRAQSARPEQKAAVLGTLVVATLTGALAVVFQYGPPTHPITRALALLWAALIGLTLYHLGHVTQATVDTGVGFLADALPPTALLHRTIMMADDLVAQRDETVQETSLLSLADRAKFTRFNRAKTAFYRSLLAATATAVATALAGRW
ncbi:hypothetical protein J2S43_001018 [Catenuloplanes nepalensis]|uniref:Uncharacterized protein n=1 Tax=Catenuloplanes nepalensis TaxID=587533 RepID=A0ABT9MM50_9ACTN|nr:hypothetical protein [Catenuloplanes nepalensis]MDP9792506.1 hypothetical protein [Catenuloplanes nepalensis]